MNRNPVPQRIVATKWRCSCARAGIVDRADRIGVTIRVANRDPVVNRSPCGE